MVVDAGTPLGGERKAAANSRKSRSDRRVCKSPAGEQRQVGQEIVVEGNLETKMLEAQVESLMSKIKAMEQHMEQLRGENEMLKQRINDKE